MKSESIPKIMEPIPKEVKAMGNWEVGRWTCLKITPTRTPALSWRKFAHRSRKSLMKRFYPFNKGLKFQLALKVQFRKEKPDGSEEHTFL